MNRWPTNDRPVDKLLSAFLQFSLFRIGFSCVLFRIATQFLSCKVLRYFLPLNSNCICFRRSLDYLSVDRLRLVFSSIFYERKPLELGFACQIGLRLITFDTPKTWPFLPNGTRFSQFEPKSFPQR